MIYNCDLRISTVTRVTPGSHRVTPGHTEVTPGSHGVTECQTSQFDSLFNPTVHLFKKSLFIEFSGSSFYFLKREIRLELLMCLI